MKIAKLLVIVMAIIGFLAINPVSAETVIDGELVKISVDMKNGPARIFKPLKNRDVKGDAVSSDWNYRYLHAKKGQSYGVTIRLKDCTKRYGVAIAVDGRDILKGEKIPADVNREKVWPAQYVLDCENSNGGTLEGWRESQDHVRRFVFTDPSDSLAGKWDDYSAMGTIVISVFREDIPEPPKTRGGLTSKGLGTGYGEKVESRVSETTFNSKPLAYEVFVLKYETESVLKTLGVWKAQEESNRFWVKKDFINFPD